MSVEAAQGDHGPHKAYSPGEINESLRAHSDSTDVNDLESDEFDIDNIERIYR